MSDNMIKLTIPGRPVPCVRMTRKSKFVNPQAQRYLDYKETVGWWGKREMSKPLPKGYSASVSMVFLLHGGQTPDIDNLIKAILDGLNGIAWVDDRQVVEVRAYRGTASSKAYECAEVEIKAV